MNLTALLVPVDPEFLAFALVLGAAAGADLALALLLLGVLPRLGWTTPPGALDLLQHPVVLGSVLLLYLAEWLMERHPGGFALWHIFQRWVRILGLFLIASLATSGAPAMERVLPIGVVVFLGMAVYVGASGWEALLLLRQGAGGASRLTAVAIDVAFAALLALALDEPLQALVALGALLLVASIQLPVSIRSHVAMIRAGRSWLHALLLPGRWFSEQELPASVCSAVAIGGPIPGKPLRGARATLLTDTVRTGWLVISSRGPFFVSGKTPAVPLRSIEGAAGRTEQLHIRKPVLAGEKESELLVFKDGPQMRDLEVEVP